MVYKFKRGILRRLLAFSAASALFYGVPQFPLNAEYVFRKDGSITAGSIVKDYPGSITLKRKDGKFEQINRKDLMRIIYTELYLGKIYARLTTGEVVEGYQVDEDRDNYFFRREIDKPEEFTIPRNKVMFISHTNPTDVRGAPATELITVTWSPPFKPAKFYRVYLRDVKDNEEKFKVAGETPDPLFVLKDLRKSWSYELYATAIADTGEESLPSEKIIVNTLPVNPENLSIDEQLSDDGTKVTLKFRWNNVTDPESRVTSYAVYEFDGGERKKRGSSPGGEFVINDYPAEGKHWFSVVSVNDLSTESDDVKAVYDAGYRIYLNGAVTFVYPMGMLKDMADYGYGALVEGGIAWRRMRFGVETGIISFSCTEYIKGMIMFPFMLEAGYQYPVKGNFSVRPALKAGLSYDVIKYVVMDSTNPLNSSTHTDSSSDPVISGCIYVQYDLNDKYYINGGVEYSAVFQESGRMSFAGLEIGAGMTF